jgi:ketosteroid isomerase-like protein
MTDDAAILEQVNKHWEALRDGDAERAHEVYHPDAVLEFPQSGERFEGLANFKEWRSRYPAKVSYKLRRVTVRDDVAIVECSVSYNDGPFQFGIQLLDFRGDKVARERIYVMEGWEAPAWRAEWRSATPSE